ncbi:microfibril-associated glycoprotein 4-like [Gigantopelta aegis]|uniref:microfibril-associated glycoprotein 4-like n=1 Tax=Gigantopelta aegis TaxID=1735272 RepID=UPI001B88A99C|nr:microfibril-associated glycoprotein 4-like [Gigantopelta aegis]
MKSTVSASFNHYNADATSGREMTLGVLLTLLCLFIQGVPGTDEKRYLGGAPAPTDCADIKILGKTNNGVYTVYPRDGKDPISVYCDLTTDGGGWLVFQRREDGSENFYRNWEDYLIGFGHLSKEFWLGNENIHRLTNQRPYQLKVDLEDWQGNKKYAIYDYFSIGPVTDYYRLFVIGYSGDAGDSLSFQHGSQFSAKNLDKDVDSRDCAKTFGGAWWYFKCHYSNLNGLYLKGSHTSYANGVNWRTFKGYYHSLKKTEMKIRPMKHLLTE